MNSFFNKIFLKRSTWISLGLLFLVSGICVIAPSSVHAAATAAAAPAASSATSGNTCTILNTSTWGSCILGAAVTMTIVFAAIIGFFLGMIGSLFNWIVVITVFQFGAYFGNSVGLLTAWGIMRDIGNILLLFGFIFMGVLTILDLNSAGTSKAIPQLIIVAVLLNFSLFAAEAVIDVSNVLSAALYNQAGAAGNNSSQCGSSTGSSACAENVGIAGQVLQATGLSQVFTSKDGLTTALSKFSSDPTHEIIVLLGLILFMVITGGVLLIGSIMLLIRGVTLTFVLVLAPLGFAASAIPPFAGIAKQWRDQLVSQSFFAPVYLLLILVSLKIMTAMESSFGIGTSGSAATVLDAFNNPQTSYGTIFIFFALIIGFMIAAVIIAKQMGAIGADFATAAVTNTGKRVANTTLLPARMAGRGIRNGGGIALRNSVGWGADKFGKAYDAKMAEWHAGTGLRKFTAKALRATGADEAIEHTAQSIAGNKFGTSRSYKEEQKFNKGRSAHLDHINHVKHLTDQIKSGASASATPDQEDQMDRALQEISLDDGIKLVNGLGENEQKKIAARLSTGKFKQYSENKDLDAKVKSNMITGRYEKQRDAVKSKKIADIKEAFKDISAKELEIVALNDPKLLSDALSFSDPTDESSVIKESVMDKLMEGDSLAGSQRKLIQASKKYEKLNAAADEIASATGAAKTAAIDRMARIAKNLDNMGKAKAKTILAASENIKLTKKNIASIVSNGTIEDPKEVKQLLANIQARHDTALATDPAYDRTEFDAIANYIKSNAAAKDFFDGNSLKP